MNISQPVSSYLGSVEFGFLTRNEIRALSVKRIQNRETFDTLLHPTPGGLYDPALGAWGDVLCSTCHLNTFSCPGHAGHIELPVPVYHPIFMDQLIVLLRGKCAYCSHLKLKQEERNIFLCKLRLLRYGLVEQAHEVEHIGAGGRPCLDPSEPHEDGDDGESVVSEDAAEETREKRLRFVKKAIKDAGGKRHLASQRVPKTEVAYRERRLLLKELFLLITKAKNCGSCAGVSPSFRKDKFNKIFRGTLSEKERAKMALAGKKSINPLIAAREAERAQQKERRADREADEGIVADLDDKTEEEATDEAESVKMRETEATMANGVVEASRSQEYVNAQEIHATISQLFDREHEMLDLIYNSRSGSDVSISPDMFFIHTMFVPPNKYRPEAKTGAGQITEAEQNALYKSILLQCGILEQIRSELTGSNIESARRRRDFDDFQTAWVGLQDAVNSLIDTDRNPTQQRGNKLNEEGIKQKLEKKEGIFRMNMMGKRVNFAARSVISPDPNIETNEIGVPPVFAKKLTYPEPVTNHNFYELKEAVLNGFDKWPGASAIENENGQVINLRFKNYEERQALANQLLAPSNVNVNGARNKKVHRHLNNGDIVIMNRQPTLHKPSMMCHRARVLPGEKTLRMHYANCNTYNADFDGDEMNLHFPQNEIARAEALHIADTDHQYLVATSGKPLRGLIQDHISMGLALTDRDTMFDRAEYYQLLYSCLRPESNHTVTDRIQVVPPAILKPRAMWTGKQLVSTILKNITPPSHTGLSLTGKSQTASDRWGSGSEEGSVIFKDGVLICGVLDKAHLGPSNGGFVHAIYEAYGHAIAGKLLSILGRLLTKLLHMRAFSCGIEDIVFTPKGDAIRWDQLKEAESVGLEVAAKYVTLDENRSSDDAELRTRLESVLRDDAKQAGLDQVYNTRSGKLSSAITAACLPAGLRKDFPKNQMQAMTTSGAKGSSVNANQISCNLGQQNLEGRRVPVMVSGKTLPCFKPFDTKLRAGGYVTDRFFSGVKPQEYYFHSMAGREGLIDTAVKTSRSGYLQRCLIKGMEGLKVEYDTSVRDSDGSMVQFLYGEDGLDVTKQKHLLDFTFLAENFFAILAHLNVQEAVERMSSKAASKWNKMAIKKVKKSGDIGIVDPALARFNPGSSYGSTSEAFASALKQYIEQNPEGLITEDPSAMIKLSKKTFSTLLDLKYMKSVIDPGEAVGIVAGQSVGEPSTQMTLNTFHLAGHSARNVTLGIPRLREIVMTASSLISTPVMTLHLNPELTEAAGTTFAKRISRVKLADIIDHVVVSELVGKGGIHDRAKIYTVRLNFFPSAEYRETYAIETADVFKAIELTFIPELTKSISKEFKRKGDVVLRKAGAPEIGKTARKSRATDSGHQGDETADHAEALENEAGESDVGDEDNDDAKNSRQRANREDSTGYEEPDEDEEAIAQEARAGSVEAEEMEDEGYGGSPRDLDSDGQDHEHGQQMRDVRRTVANSRSDRILSRHDDITHFRYDEKMAAWCEICFEYDATSPKLLMLNLVESACHSAVIQAIPGLGQCMLTKEKIRDPIAKTEVEIPVVVTAGVNLTAMLRYQNCLNPHKIFTNDIVAMLTHYGVEACRATIIREMDSVFKSHSITVDNRHLNLISDVMTRGGGFTPFSRTGMKTAVSPFMKMSFETTVGFLKDAVLDCDWDDLKGPSSRIVMGKIGNIGTGAFDVLMPV